MCRRPVLLLPLLLLGAAACTAGPNALVGTPGAGGAVAGFWLGLWHGIICPITFIISLFRSDIAFYEVHNNGAWYNFGFLLGIGIMMRVGPPSWRKPAPAKRPPVKVEDPEDANAPTPASREKSTYRKTGYQGQRATALWYDADAERYDATKALTFDLGECEVKR